MLQVLDDLELQAEGLHLADRDATVAELSVSTYAEVDLVSRLHASVGLAVRLVVQGAGAVDGVVTRAGRDWVLLDHGRTDSIVRTAAVLRVRGASDRAVPETARNVTAKLGYGSVLRQVAAEGDAVAATLVDGSSVRGWIRRVGADFLEVATDDGAVELVGLDALVLVHR